VQSVEIRWCANMRSRKKMIIPTLPNIDLGVVRDQNSVAAAVPIALTFSELDLGEATHALLQLGVANGYELPRMIAKFDEATDKLTVVVVDPSIAIQIKSIVEDIRPIETPQEWFAYARCNATFGTAALGEIYKCTMGEGDRKAKRKLCKTVEAAIEVIWSEDDDEEIED
jgi:hypothetical protein